MFQPFRDGLCAGVSIVLQSIGGRISIAVWSIFWRFWLILRLFSSYPRARVQIKEGCQRELHPDSETDTEEEIQHAGVQTDTEENLEKEVAQARQRLKSLLKRQRTIMV